MADTTHFVVPAQWTQAPFAGDTLVQNTGAQTLLVRHAAAAPDNADLQGFEVEPGDSYDTSRITGQCWLRTRYVPGQVEYQEAG